MAVGRDTFPPLPPVAGFRLGTVGAGIKTPGRKDLVVMECAVGSSVAGVFTRNAFCAAPVQIAKAHLASLSLETSRRSKALLEPCYFIVNTGNANAGTGARGLADAMAVCEATAGHVGLDVDRVLPFSTGVIGEALPVTTIIEALPEAVASLVQDGWRDAAEGILTTDTRPKGAFRQLDINGVPVTVAGIAKGSGMIRPDMATMLAFIVTDAKISQQILQRILAEASEQSFNRITVDGDTSTNDCAMLVATGQSDFAFTPDSSTTKDDDTLRTAIIEVCKELAQAIVRDGEGASKFVTVKVSGGGSERECLDVAYTVAESALVKTALFASDPNWGRILAAIGRAGLDDFDVDRVRVCLDDVLIAEHGGRAETYSEAAGQAVMGQDEITINIDLGRGRGQASFEQTLWTADLSHEYVRINAEYRS